MDRGGKATFRRLHSLQEGFDDGLRLRRSLPPACLGSTALAALRRPRAFELHEGLPHALLRVRQVHMGQVHLEGIFFFLVRRRGLLPHIVAGVRHTFQLPLANVLIPVHIVFDHLLVVLGDEVVYDEHLQAQFAAQLADVLQQALDLPVVLLLQVGHL